MRHVATFRSSRLFGAASGRVSATARLATTKARVAVSFMVSLVSGSGGRCNDLDGWQRCERTGRGASYSTLHPVG
jgi:hypothetical protein